ncbi:ribulose-phosphate 3-epimerase [Paraburkholderia nemoris]|uniref:Ribulose-phosphate 3-epimerase n=1 Tax=Paraburkholderia nemoris TaxID=2793076 RepID=A0ABN7N653_9BURK|nr:ribulose-phosphate 3-epimerase [Paraburkholderia nemoris]CAE6824727.1 Ribulose-phosphate 3-epimerase [Paraburkholderia nemoris]CAE6855489.1 Ribulose-phosphate 3-epimerase [Paraburkholderia nemoris]
MDIAWKKSCLIVPSIITFDLCNLERQAQVIAESGLDAVHLDVIDGHFSPSMPLGIETIVQLRRKTGLAFDVHVMASRHDYFIDALLDIGVQQLTFQMESEPHIDRMLDRIRAAGVRAGVALKPSTPLSTLEYVLERCDTVLLMLTNPGYAASLGETQVPYAKRKILALREMICQQGVDTAIEIDGRVSKETIRKFAPATVDMFVAGSLCISRESPSAGLSELAELRRSLVSTTQ